MKIDVITVKLTCHIPVNRDDRNAVDEAYAIADGLGDGAAALGQTSYEARLNRVTAPEPKSVAEPVEGDLDTPESKPKRDDDLDVPPNLRRTGGPISGLMA